MKARQMILAAFLVLLVPVTMLTLDRIEKSVIKEPDKIADQSDEKVLGAKAYSTHWIKVKDLGKLELIANFKDTSSAKDIKERGNCILLTSARFPEIPCAGAFRPGLY